MARSRTRKKSNKDIKLPPELSAVADLATEYIANWTTRELARISLSYSTPLCVPTKHGYKIGVYTLTVNKNKTCELKDTSQEFTHTFDSKVSAVLYAIYTIKNNLNTAREILTLDKEINKNYTDILAMRSMRDRARAKKDYEMFDIRQTRLELAQNQLDLARDKISKIHKQAKYFKVWE